MAAQDSIDIEPGGDVVLICDTNEKQVKLRVSSAVLVRASQVFKALLAPHFKEGTDLAASHFVEIPFPDDCGSSMQIICNVLHQRNDFVPESLDTSEILGIAVLTDKYACMVAMKYVAKIWMLPHLQNTGVPLLHKLLKATMYFNDSALFLETCKTIIWRSEGPIKADRDHSLDGLTHVIEHLDRQRTCALNDISALINRRIERLAYKYCPERKCNVGGSILSQFIIKLSQKGLFGSSTGNDESIETLEKRLETFECKVSQINHPTSCGARECRSIIYDADSIMSLSGNAEEVGRRVKLPCFRCVREGSYPLDDKCDHE